MADLPTVSSAPTTMRIIRRLIKVILARKRDASGWRAEARRWERLYHLERQTSRDLLDKVLAVTGAGTIQEKPAAPSEPREVRLEDLTDQEFERQMEAAEIDEWVERARHDITARTFLEGISVSNPTAARALEKLRFTQ